MKIGEFLKESFIDYSGKISAVVFSPRCNYRCPACHAMALLTSNRKRSEEEFFDYLDSRKGWIEGVVLCGGEPTLEPRLVDFAGKLKKKGLAVKLDTNGSNPEVLSELKKEGIIDYVAMDVKSPRELYETVTGVSEVNLKNIEESLKIVSKFPAFEFRTTIVPLNRGNERINFMTPEEVEDIAKWIIETTKSNKHKYFLCLSF